MGSAEESTIRLRSLEGEEVPWPRNAAQRAAFLKNLMDDAPTNDNDNVYPVSAVSTAVLVSLERLCDPDYDQSASLAEKSAQELFKLRDGSNFLDAAPALEHVQRALASLLDGKKVDELRGLLHATDDLTPEERVAALAEPIFMPVAEPIFMPVADGPQPAAAMAPPCLLQQPSLSGVEGTDDAKGLALCAVDIGTLTEFKGVNRFWGAVARHELCSRLCCREGQQAPQKAGRCRRPRCRAPRARRAAMGRGGSVAAAAQPEPASRLWLPGELGGGADSAFTRGSTGGT